MPTVLAAIALVAGPGLAATAGPHREPPAGISPRAGPAAATALHTRLLRSEPPDSATLAALPERVRLVFSGPVEAGLSAATLLLPGGDSLRLAAHRDSADHAVVIVGLPALSRVAPGFHRLRFAVVAPDGHPVRGEIVYDLRPPDAALGPAPGNAAGAGERGPAGEAAERRPTAPPAGGAPSLAAPVWAVLLRGVARAALLALTGCLVFLGWTRVPLAPGADRLARALAWAAALLLAGDLAAWAGGVTGSTGGGLGAALGTRAGETGLLRVGLAILALWAVALARRPGLAAVFAAAAVLVDGASGHPAAIRPWLSVPTKGLHLAAVSVWLGGLLALAGGGDTAGYERRARAVSSAALGAVVAVALTGIAESVLFLPRLSDLTGSPYGLLLLGKAAGLTVLVGFGAYHRFRLIPRLGGGGVAPLRRSVRREVAVMAAVILLAALLAHVPPPEAEPAPTVVSGDAP